MRTWFAVFFIAVIASAGFIWWQQQSTAKIIERQLEQIQQVKPPPRLVRAEADLAFVGDIFLGRGVDREARRTDSHAQYPFANLGGFNLDQYQTVVGNLECPSVNDEVDYQQQFSALLFNCPTSYLPQLAEHFDILSLANNHTGNQGGQVGLATTRSNLAENDIKYFGNYEPAVTEDICKLIPIDTVFIYSDGTRLIDKIAVQFCGYHTVFRRASADEVAAITKASNLPTFVMPHAGAEYRATPISAKVSEFQAMVDAGADAVIGTHPHWVQTTEIYEDKLIAYSLGNFIFDQLPGETSLGAILGAQLMINDTEYLTQLRSIADSCSSLDDCELIAQLNKPELSLEYHVQAVDIVDYRPQLGSGDSQQKVGERMQLPTATNSDSMLRSDSDD